MIAQELRVGNLIFDQEEGKYYPIEEIREDDNGFEGYFVTYRNGSCSILVEHIDPIPLSEDWLRWLGFTSNVRKTIWHIPINEYGDLISINCVDGRYRLVYNAVQIDYVHQLQNLFFALTGEELKLKEE